MSTLPQASKETIGSNLKFTVKVPASTSNMGPGFDTLGLALDIYNEYTFDTDTEDFVYSSNIDEDTVPWNKENLVFRAFDYLFRKERKSTPAIKIHFDAKIPLTGGFGSSSTAIVAGLIAANKLLDSPYNKDQILRIGTQLDGHPDNVTPAILGGFVVCVYADQKLHYINLPWHEDLSFVAITPHFKLPTAKARAALPAQVNYADAVYNIGHSSLLVAALATKDTETLRAAFKDRMHQAYRANLVPGMQYVLDAGVEAGALGTMLSGAGSTLIAIVESDEIAKTVASAMQAAWLQSSIDSKVHYLKAEPNGAQII